jgi:hypothetical protein
MLEIVTAPNETKSEDISVFIAGGISNCYDWQSEYILNFKKMNIFGDKNIIMFNPRRYDFDITNKVMEEEQIRWEFNKLHKADIISFWFPKETVCPITLYELGYWIDKENVSIIIGCDPMYSRKNDVEIQTALAGYTKKIHTSIDELVDATAKEILNFVW